MNVLDAVETVLKQSGQPMGVKAIADAVLDQKLWSSNGKTPNQTIQAQIAVDIKKNPNTSRIERVGKGLFALRGGIAMGVSTVLSAVSTANSAPVSGASLSAATLTFADAAETVLNQQKAHAPMHYQQITKLALAQGLVNTQGQTPEATMYAQVLTEIKRQTLRGQTPRFTRHG